MYIVNCVRCPTARSSHNNIFSSFVVVFKSITRYQTNESYYSLVCVINMHMPKNESNRIDSNKRTNVHRLWKYCKYTERCVSFQWLKKYVGITIFFGRCYWDAPRGNFIDFPSLWILVVLFLIPCSIYTYIKYIQKPRNRTLFFLYKYRMAIYKHVFFCRIQHKKATFCMSVKHPEH